MGILDIFRRGIKRIPRDWQFYTRTGHIDFEYKTKSPYETFDKEAHDLKTYAFSYLTTHDGRKKNKESFTCVTSKRLVLYVYHFDDGRRDDCGRWISNWLMVFLTPDEAKKYSAKDFVEEIYAKKTCLGMTYPTGFDFANKFPIIWDEEKQMESNDKLFLKAHKHAHGGDFAFYKKDFLNSNTIWRDSKKENATYITTTYIPEKPKNK